MAKKSRKPWTIQEDERLRELAATGDRLSEIGEKLDRTVSAAKARAYVLRVSFRRFGSKKARPIKSG
jgi:hypothetical protein